MTSLRTGVLVLALVPFAFPTGASAQVTGFEVTVGPSYRWRTGASGVGPEHRFDGLSVGATWTQALSSRVGLQLGVGGYLGETVVSYINVPCLPEGPCPPPNPSPDGHVAGELYTLQVGLAIRRSNWRATVGGALGHAPGGVEQWGAGGFGSLQFSPLRRVPGLSIGMSGLLLTPAPGHTRAVMTPTIGLRF